MQRPCEGTWKLWLGFGADATQEGTEGPKKWFGKRNKWSVLAHGLLVTLTTSFFGHIGSHLPLFTQLHWGVSQAVLWETLLQKGFISTPSEEPGASIEHTSETPSLWGEGEGNREGSEQMTQGLARCADNGARGGRAT